MNMHADAGTIITMITLADAGMNITMITTKPIRMNRPAAFPAGHPSAEKVTPVPWEDRSLRSSAAC